MKIAIIIICDLILMEAITKKYTFHNWEFWLTSFAAGLLTALSI